MGSKVKKKEKGIAHVFQDVSFQPPQAYAFLPAFNAEQMPALAMGYAAAKDVWRPSYTREGTWLSTCAADQAKELFTVLWRAEAFGAPPFAPDNGQTLSAFTLGYLIHVYGLPSLMPVHTPSLQEERVWREGNLTKAA